MFIFVSYRTTGMSISAHTQQDSPGGRTVRSRLEDRITVARVDMGIGCMEDEQGCVVSGEKQACKGEIYIPSYEGLYFLSCIDCCLTYVECSKDDVDFLLILTSSMVELVYNQCTARSSTIARRKKFCS